MIISKEEAERLIENKDNLVALEKSAEDALIDEFTNEVSISPEDTLKAIRAPKANVPPIFREIIATQAQLPGVSNASLSRSFGIDKSSIHRYRNGHVNTQAEIKEYGLRKSDKELSERLTANVGIIREKVTEKLIKTLDSMDDSRIESATLKELATVASSLGRVYSSTMDKDIGGNTLNVQTIFMKPEPKRVNDYEVIDA